MHARRLWAAGLAGALSLSLVTPTSSQPPKIEPWAEPQDAAQAINSPDAYAWRLFVALNWPADSAKRAADPKKKLGVEGPVVWETWKNARDVFLPKGSDPGPWLAGGAPAGPRPIDTFDALPLQQQLRRRMSGGGVKFDPLSAEAADNETRLNKDTYEFVRKHELYNVDGQLAYFRSSATHLSFDVGAKETKAQWREINAADKPRYHWAEVVKKDGSKIIYGLTALHITTKDLPNWFWATFEHVDNPKLPGNESWLLPSRDTFACKGKAPDCNAAPTGIGLEGTKWINYRLRGTQVDFTDPTGRPTLLANSQPEQFFQTTSSCMTCHSRASIGLINGDPDRLSVFKPNGDGEVGPIQEAWYWTGSVNNPDGRTQVYKPLDFVWSLFRAQPKAP